MAVSDYKTDPNENTTISGINIAEGCAPSGINNAIRQLMADVKADKTEQDTAMVKTVNGNAPDAAGNVAITNITGNAGTATKLKEARTVRTNLASTSTASFDGSANVTPGVTGVLPIANGGTGSNVEKYLSLAGGTMAGGIDMNGNNLVNVNNLNAYNVRATKGIANVGYVFQPLETYLSGLSRYMLRTATGYMIDTRVYDVTVGTGAWLGFYDAFSASPFVFVSLIGTAGGWVPRVASVSTTTFQLSWDYWSSSGKGTAVKLYVLAIGPYE